MDKINKFIVFAVLSFATLASHIQASQNHKVNTFVLNWLHVCHQANKGSTSFLDTQNQESCLADDESSRTSMENIKCLATLYELLDAQVGQDSEKDDLMQASHSNNDFKKVSDSVSQYDEELKQLASISAAAAASSTAKIEKINQDDIQIDTQVDISNRSDHVLDEAVRILWNKILDDSYVVGFTPENYWLLSKGLHDFCKNNPEPEWTMRDYDENCLTNEQRKEVFRQGQLNVIYVNMLSYLTKIERYFTANKIDWKITLENKVDYLTPK